jgi:hypothetical protein
MPPKITRAIFELSYLRGLASAASQCRLSCPTNPLVLSEVVSALFVRMRRKHPTDAQVFTRTTSMIDRNDPAHLQETIGILVGRFPPDECRLLKWLIRCLAAWEEQGIADDGPDLLLSRPRLLDDISRLAIPSGMHWAPVVLAQKINLVWYFEHVDKHVMDVTEPDPYPLGRKNHAQLRRSLWLKRHERTLLELLDFPCRCERSRSLGRIMNEHEHEDRWIGDCESTESAIIRILSEWHGLRDSGVRELVDKQHRQHFKTRR